MKTFKQVDVAISIVLILSFTIVIIVSQDLPFAIIAYFWIGGWQVVSMLVHEGFSWFTEKGGRRRNYHWAVLITLVSALSVYILPFLFFIYFLLFFAAPMMAAWYSWMCFREIKSMTRRPLSVLM